MFGEKQPLKDIWQKVNTKSAFIKNEFALITVFYHKTLVSYLDEALFAILSIITKTRPCNIQQYFTAVKCSFSDENF